MKFLKLHRLSPLQFILINCIFWMVFITLALPNTDRYGDTIEAFGWSQHWLMGTNKHPQFLPWVINLWFQIMPRNLFTIYMLSAVNLFVSLLGIYYIGKALQFSKSHLMIALGLTFIAMSYLNLQDKLNMNTILTAVWPWTAWAFIRACQEKSARQLLFTALFAVMAVISLLSKYYSMVLLMVIFIISLTPDYRAFYRPATIFVFAAMFTALIAPHILWLIKYDFVTLKYAAEQDSGHINWTQIGAFFAGPLFYWGIPFLVGLCVFYTGNPWQRIKSSVRANGISDALWYFAYLPWIITLILGMVGAAELSGAWLIPVGFTYTLLMVRNADEEKLNKFGDKFINAFKFIWPLNIALALALTFIYASTDDSWHYVPEVPMMEKIETTWKAEYPEIEPTWAAPKFQGARFAFFTNFKNEVDALPTLPNQLPAYFPQVDDWQTKAGLYICDFKREAEKNSACVVKASKWAEKNNMNFDVKEFTITLDTWRHWHDIPQHVSVVFITPKQKQ